VPDGIVNSVGIERQSLETATVDVVEASWDSRELEDAAQIWAEATALRGGQGDIADLADSLPVFEAVRPRRFGKRA